MKHFLYASVTVLALALASSAQAPADVDVRLADSPTALTAPVLSFTAQPGQMRRLAVDSKIGRVTWINTNPLLQMEVTDSGCCVLLCSTVPGTYRVAGFGATMFNGQPKPTLPVYVEMVVENPNGFRAPAPQLPAKATPPAKTTVLPTAPVPLQIPPPAKTTNKQTEAGGEPPADFRDD